MLAICDDATTAKRYTESGTGPRGDPQLSSVDLPAVASSPLLHFVCLASERRETTVLGRSHAWFPRRGPRCSSELRHETTLLFFSRSVATSHTDTNHSFDVAMLPTSLPLWTTRRRSGRDAHSERTARSPPPRRTSLFASPRPRPTRHVRDSLGRAPTMLHTAPYDNEDDPRRRVEERQAPTRSGLRNRRPMLSRVASDVSTLWFAQQGCLGLVLSLETTLSQRGGRLSQRADGRRGLALRTRCDAFQRDGGLRSTTEGRPVLVNAEPCQIEQVLHAATVLIGASRLRSAPAGPPPCPGGPGRGEAGKRDLRLCVGCLARLGLAARLLSLRSLRDPSQLYTPALSL